MLKSIFIISKKELMDNIRNKWIIILTIIFTSLTLVVSYFGSIYTNGWQDLGTTIQGMSNLVTLLIPIIALMLGYAAIIGDIEKGSMSSLLSLLAHSTTIPLTWFLAKDAWKNNLLSYIDTVTVPVLYIHSEDDYYAPIGPVKQLANKTKQATTWWINESSTHACHHIKHAQAYEQRIQQFLNAIFDS